MIKIRVTHTTEYPIDSFNKLIKDKLFAGKNARIDYVIREVGGDPFGRYRGNEEVVSVRIEYDE